MKLLQRAFRLLRRIFSGKGTKESKQDFPPTFYRGISFETDIDAGAYLKASAFQFGEIPVDREDGNRELSIVWNDCEDSLLTLLQQRNKKGTAPQFACGYATIRLSKFQDMVISYITGNLVKYERKPIKEDVDRGVEANPYHGNILLHKTASDQIKKNVQHSLATIAEFSRRPDSNSNY